MQEQAVEILLVEDNEDDIELTLRALKKNNLGNKIFVVKDGAEALDYIFLKGAYENYPDNQLPKLILLDINLPKVGGLDVLRALKSNDRTKMIPVVVMTTSDEEKDLVESYRLGVNSYIKKPVDFNSFISVMAQLGYYWLVLNTYPH